MNTDGHSTIHNSRIAKPTKDISFIDALRWLRLAGDGRVLIDLVVNPNRPGRVEPRVVKRRPKPYPLMTRPRRELRQDLMNAKVAPKVHAIRFWPL